MHKLGAYDVESQLQELHWKLREEKNSDIQFGHFMNVFPLGD